MAATYDPIATVSLLGASTISFSSIPATYTDLRVVISGAVATGLQNLFCQFNGDTATNYSRTALDGNGTSTESMRESNFSSIFLERNSYFTTSPSMFLIDIMNYANTSINKTLLSRASNAGVGTSLIVGLWQSTAAINAILMTLSGSTFAAGSKATLFGIKAA